MNPSPEELQQAIEQCELANPCGDFPFYMDSVSGKALLSAAKRSQYLKRKVRNE